MKTDLCQYVAGLPTYLVCGIVGGYRMIRWQCASVDVLRLLHAETSASEWEQLFEHPCHRSAIDLHGP